MSEFGTGLTYNLALFCMHRDRMFKTKGMEPYMWFNAAADHLYELQIDTAPEHLRTQLSALQDRCLGWRLPMNDRPYPTWDDVDKAVWDALNLLMSIDLHLGVESEAADYE